MPGRRRRPILRGLLGLLVLLVAVVLVGAFLGWQAWSAYRSGQQANADLVTFRERLLDRDVEGAEAALRSAQQASATARDSLDGPLWGAAASLPGVGDDVRAARELTVVVDDVAQGALPAVMTALSYADPSEIGFVDGRIKLGPVRQASDQLVRGADLLREADQSAAGISTDGVTSDLADRVDDAQAQLARTSRLARTAATASRLLPDMLGGSGPRDYLVLAQNNAEQRSLGGLVGAMVQLRADDGRLRLVRQVVPADFGTFERPVVPLTPSEVALYGDVLGQYPGNVTNAPSFPRAAELVTAMWEQRIGGEIDGVAAIDPWALQLLVGALGPIDTDAGRLTGENTVQRLLVDVYQEIEDPDQQNAVFAQAARAVFDAVRGGQGDPRAVIGALSEGVDEGRVMLWSARDPEQDVLADTPLGRVLDDPTPDTPQLGVYLQDLTQSKMDVFQRVDVDVRPESCGSSGQAEVTISLRSTAPEDRDLPVSVTGNGFRVEPGDIATRVVVYAPPGWGFSGAESSDGPGGLTTYQDQGMLAGFRDVVLQPGDRERLRITLIGDEMSSDWQIRFTPGTTPATVRADVSGC